MKQRNGLYALCVKISKRYKYSRGLSGLCPFLDTESIKYDTPSFKFNPFVISLKLQSTMCHATHLAFDQKRTQWLSKCLLQAFKKISYYINSSALWTVLVPKAANQIIYLNTVSTQILQHSWLERHLTIFWQKVHFLGQILDYNSQIWSKFESNSIKKAYLIIRTAPFYLREYSS